MILCEHFIYGLEPKNGIQIYKTLGINKIVDENDLFFLSHVGDEVTEETDFRGWFIQRNSPTEVWVTITRVRPVTDEYGRKGVWNHTMLTRLNDYLTLKQPQTVFAPYFIRALDESKKYTPLQPITIEE